MSEIQESYQLLQEVDRLLAEIEAKISVIEGSAPKLESTLKTFTQLEQLALRWLVLARRMGLPEELDRGINLVARMISAIRMMQMASSLLMMTNPVTFAIGAAGLLGGALSLTDAFAGY